MTRHYKPNVVYVLKVKGLYYYVGCETSNKEFLPKNRILEGSGNPLKSAYSKGYITHQEYLDNVELLFVEEYQSRDDARDREVELIQEYYELYPNLLMNKCLQGNKGGSTGYKWSESMKIKLRRDYEGSFYNEATSNYRKMKQSGEWKGNWREFMSYYSSIWRKKCYS